MHAACLARSAAHALPAASQVSHGRTCGCTVPAAARRQQAVAGGKRWRLLLGPLRTSIAVAAAIAVVERVLMPVGARRELLRPLGTAPNWWAAGEALQRWRACGWVIRQSRQRAEASQGPPSRTGLACLLGPWGWRELEANARPPGHPGMLPRLLNAPPGGGWKPSVDKAAAPGRRLAARSGPWVGPPTHREAREATANALGDTVLPVAAWHRALISPIPSAKELGT